MVVEGGMGLKERWERWCERVWWVLEADGRLEMERLAKRNSCIFT